MVSYAQIDGRLIVVLRLQQTVRPVCLHSHLWQGEIVHAGRNARTFCEVIIALSVSGYIGIVVFVASEDIEFLPVVV